VKKCIILFCAFCLLLCACGKSEETTIIRAAVCPTMPPYLFEENGQYRGLDLELFEGFCKARGYRYTITAYDWQGMLGAVIGNQADVAFSNISITEKRKKSIDFSKPYADDTWNLISLKKRNIVIKDLVELKKYTIGYPRGMAFGDLIREQLEPRGIYRSSDVQLYPTYNQALADLRSGNIDLLFMERTVAAIHKRKMDIQDSYVFTGIDVLGFAFPQGSPLRDDFDRYLAKLGPAKLKAISDKWMK